MNKYYKTIFNLNYRFDLWHISESKSGPGPTLSETSTVRKQLSLILKKFGIKSLLDISCGDFHWMKEIKFDDSIQYLGADIVKKLIAENKSTYETPKKKFVVLDLLKDELPAVDLIFCRDCLVHLNDDQVWLALKNMQKSGSRYLLTTTYPGLLNKNLRFPKSWRLVNFQAPPFNFPDPIELFNEESRHTKEYHDKMSLGFWALRDII